MRNRELLLVLLLHIKQWLLTKRYNVIALISVGLIRLRKQADPIKHLAASYRITINREKTRVTY